jgi:hypothetical protein
LSLNLTCTWEFYFMNVDTLRTDGWYISSGLREQ